MSFQVHLPFVLLLSIGAAACGEDGDDDASERDDVDMPSRGGEPTPAGSSGGDQADRGASIQQCVEACIREASTCTAGCNGATCGADCDADFSGCSKECSEIH